MLRAAPHHHSRWFDVVAKQTRVAAEAGEQGSRLHRPFSGLKRLTRIPAALRRLSAVLAGDFTR
eukprot:11979798-Alexandrium_andersonii.AAC.1